MKTAKLNISQLASQGWLVQSNVIALWSSTLGAKFQKPHESRASRGHVRTSAISKDECGIRHITIQRAATLFVVRLARSRSNAVDSS